MIAERDDLTRRDYELFRRLVYTRSGINLGDEKMQLVRARLGKRVRQGNFESFRDYYDCVERDHSGVELSRLLDAISTNTTHLFRENAHFELLSDIIEQWTNDQDWLAKNSTLRLWSAGCSSGEEPHSIAMIADSSVRKQSRINTKILATDLSVEMLRRACLGIYDPDRAGAVPSKFKDRYMKKVEHDGKPMLEVVEDIRRIIKFARFNLMTPTFPFRRGFHVIFCRNVMIYFDRKTQTALVNKFAKHLCEGGYLMIGHSESLSAIEHPLSYVQPTVYRKD